MAYSKKLFICFAIAILLAGASSSYAFMGGGGGASPEYSVVYDQLNLSGGAGDPITWMVTITNDPNSTGLDYMKVYDITIQLDKYSSGGYTSNDFTINFSTPLVLGSGQSTYTALATFTFDAGTPAGTIIAGKFFVDMMFADDPSFNIETTQYRTDQQAFSALLTPSGSTIPEPISAVLLGAGIVALRKKFRR